MKTNRAVLVVLALVSLAAIDAHPASPRKFTVRGVCSIKVRGAAPRIAASPRMRNA